MVPPSGTFAHEHNCRPVHSSKLTFADSGHYRGRSAVVGGSSIIVHNLGQGFDRYDLEHQQLVQHYATLSTPEANVPLPVITINNKGLLLGSSCGEVKVSDLSGQIVQTLSHPGA